MGIKLIYLSPGNKPENLSKRREQCGAIGQSRYADPGSGLPRDIRGSLGWK
jgi:hypothetical protein